MLTPAQPDNRSIILILAFQGSLLFFTVLGSYLLDGGLSLGLSSAESSWFPVASSMQPRYFIDQSSLQLVAFFSAAMIGTSFHCRMMKISYLDLCCRLSCRSAAGPPTRPLPAAL